MRIRHIKGAEEMVAAHPLAINEPEKHKENWRKEVFGNDAPLYLEIGTGMGTFIRESAIAHPDIDYVGIEMNSTVLLKAMRRYEKKAEEEGVTPGGNLRFMRLDARLLEECFGENEVDRIYLNFSDPWPKDKNANKRLTSPMFLARYKKVLKPEGTIEFKTDNRGLFDYSVETAGNEGWEILKLTYDLHADATMNEGNIETEYEAKFSAKGNKIGKMIIRAGRKTDSVQTEEKGAENA